ncbi:MAG: hypothetical protein ABI675_20320 [Chitinophagaceae bacterium]
MSVSMRFEKLRNGQRSIKIDGEIVRVWASYNCTFDRKPKADELGQKKSKFRKFLNSELLKLTNGNLFSFRRLKWTKNESNPLKFQVVVPIEETNPPTTNGTPPPSPAPSGPGPM